MTQVPLTALEPNDAGEMWRPRSMRRAIGVLSLSGHQNMSHLGGFE
ncbi:MAG: hypothetical protein JWM97_1865 [Phycisphaerales bacterium]|jgi:hypothetical protein|nr:hypothetical protein [Phycisphaerales bacterium]